MDQRSFFGLKEQLARISACGDLLETLERTVDFGAFQSRLVAGLGYGDGAKGGRPPFDPVSMFNLLILQTHRNLSDARGPNSCCAAAGPDARRAWPADGGGATQVKARRPGGDLSVTFYEMGDGMGDAPNSAA
jgi:hypothetical protein